MGRGADVEGGWRLNDTIGQRTLGRRARRGRGRDVAFNWLHRIAGQGPGISATRRNSQELDSETAPRLTVKLSAKWQPALAPTRVALRKKRKMDASAQPVDKNQGNKNGSAQPAENNQEIRIASAQPAEKIQQNKNASAQLAENNQEIKNISAQESQTIFKI